MTPKKLSERNIKLMVQFHRCYPDAFQIGQPPVAQLGVEVHGSRKGSRPDCCPRQEGVKSRQNARQHLFDNRE